VVGYSHFVYSAELIFQEAASNIIRHGFGGEFLDRHLQLELAAVKVYDLNRRAERLAFQMELSDDAPPFNPTTAKWREPDPLEPRESGYGIYLIRKLTDGVSYRYEQGRNYLKMYKFIEIAG
jgi:anti-sigma regulatory factor (Ser/Thr protein kinase)